MVSAVDAQRPNRDGRGLGPCGAGDGPAVGMRYNLDSPAQFGKMNRMAMLDLSEEQQAEITSLRNSHYKVITPMKNKMVELKARERTELSEEQPDLKAINKTIDEQTELASSIRKLQVEQQVAVKALLSDEQIMQLEQRRMYARRDAYKGKRGQRNDGPARGAGYGRGYRGW